MVLNRPDEPRSASIVLALLASLLPFLFLIFPLLQLILSSSFGTLFLLGDLGTFLEQQGDNPRLKGFRRLIQGEKDADFAASKSFVDGVRSLGEGGFSFDLCIYHHQLPAVSKLARQVPEIPLVLYHIGKPDIKSQLFSRW